MQTIKAEGVNFRKPGEDLSEDIDEEIAIRTEQAQHASVRILHHVDFRISVVFVAMRRHSGGSPYTSPCRQGG